MFESITESTFRITTHTDNRLSGEQNRISIEKVERTVEERPVEGTQESPNSTSDKLKKSGGFNMDENGIFYEFYDEDGNVISRQPLEKKPIDELV